MTWVRARLQKAKRKLKLKRLWAWIAIEWNLCGNRMPRYSWIVPTHVGKRSYLSLRSSREMIHLETAQYYALPCEADELQLLNTRLHNWCGHDHSTAITARRHWCLFCPFTGLQRMDWQLALSIYRYTLHNWPGEPILLRRARTETSQTRSLNTAQAQR